MNIWPSSKAIGLEKDVTQAKTTLCYLNNGPRGDETLGHMSALSMRQVPHFSIWSTTGVFSNPVTRESA